MNKLPDNAMQAVDVLFAFLSPLEIISLRLSAF
jgi:hypothetical protein